MSSPPPTPPAVPPIFSSSFVFEFRPALRCWQFGSRVSISLVAVNLFLFLPVHLLPDLSEKRDRGKKY